MDNYSVIIRTRDEERFIGYALQSLVDKIGNKFELIIVDNNSKDDTLRIINLFEYLDPKLISIDGPKYTPGLALNEGVKISNNDKIMIFSAHCELVNFSEELVSSTLETEDCYAIFGKQNPIYQGKKITPRYIWSHFDDKFRENYYSDLEERYFLHNAFAIYKKEALVKFPFDDRLPGKEDRYWAQEVIKNNLKFIYEPKLQCNHHFTPNGNTWKGVG